MFDGLKRLWGRIVSMFNYTTLKNIIGKDVALSQTMIDAINEWKRMLAGNADCIDCYRDKYGEYKTVDNYAIYFIPNLMIFKKI